MDSILKSAQVRKIDNFKSQERKYQRLREAEGDEFKDKEVFVTASYLELKQKLRDQIMEPETTTDGMKNFYKSYLDQYDLPVKECIIPPQIPTTNLNVRRNDYGEIVDKRELLEEGLNVPEVHKKIDNITKTTTKEQINDAKKRYLERKKNKNV